MSQNHYHVLGLAATASAADIKRAYRQLAVRYHPDKHGGDARYEDQFKSVALAYRILGDPGRRATYDFQVAQAARRAEELRRQQQHRPATQHVYGVPMPPPQPLRTRPPAGSRERHYQTIPRQRTRFNRRDWLLTGLIMLAFGLFSLAVKVVMDRVTATADYEEGLRAFGRGDWATAQNAFDAALHFRPGFGAALRRRAELEQFALHDPAAARADYKAALLQPQSPPVAAELLYHLGRCQTALGQPAAADTSYSRALALAPALSAAYLARGQGRLLNLPQPAPAAALADLQRGLRLRQQTGRGPHWPSVQLAGLALARLGRYPEAQATYEQVLQACPADGRTHFLLGRLAQQTHDTAAACTFFGRAVALHYPYAEAAWQQCPQQRQGAAGTVGKNENR